VSAKWSFSIAGSAARRRCGLSAVQTPGPAAVHCKRTGENTVERRIDRLQQARLHEIIGQVGPERFSPQALVVGKDDDNVGCGAGGRASRADHNGQRSGTGKESEGSTLSMVGSSDAVAF